MTRVRIRGFIKRMVSLDVRSEEEMVEIIERLTTRLTYVDFKVDTKPGHMRITLYGAKDLVREAIFEIHEIVRTVRGLLYPDAKGRYAYSVRELMSMVSGIAIPLNLLMLALRLRGYDADVEGGMIRTNAPYETVSELASAISDAYQEMRLLRITPTCKRLIALYAAIKEVSIGEAIEDLEAAKLIKRDEQGDRYMLALEFNQALSRLEKMLREEGVGPR